MLKQMRKLVTAGIACAAIVLLPALAEARVQKPGAASKRAPQLRVKKQTLRNGYRPLVRQNWRYQWWNSLDVHQKTDWMLYGTYLE